MTRKNGLGLSVVLFAMLFLFLSARSVFAESDVWITKPADGSTIEPGNVQIWVRHASPTGNWSTDTLAADYLPLTLKIYKGSVLLDEKKINTMELSFVGDGNHAASIDLNEEGTYTIKASVPKTSGEWDQVTFKVSKNGASGSGSSASTVKDEPEWVTTNPGFYLQPEKDSYSAKPGDTVKIKFSMSLDAAALQDPENKLWFYCDHVPESSKKLIKYKALSDYTWVKKGNKYVADGSIEYSCLKSGKAELFAYVAINGTKYDKHVITINTKDPAAASTTKAVTKKKLKKTTITAKNKTYKAKTKVKKYTVVLKSGKTLVKNAKVKLKVNGKTYTAKTNKKGKATFKITKLKKKGKYTATITYAGNKTYKKTTKKVKITVKK